MRVGSIVTVTYGVAVDLLISAPARCACRADASRKEDDDGINSEALFAFDCTFICLSNMHDTTVIRLCFPYSVQQSH